MNKIHHCWSKFLAITTFIRLLYIKASSQTPVAGFLSKKHGPSNKHLFTHLSLCLRALTFLVSDPCKWCPGYGGGPVLTPALLDKTSHPPLWTSPGRREAYRGGHTQRIIRWMPIWPLASKTPKSDESLSPLWRVLWRDLLLWESQGSNTTSLQSEMLQIHTRFIQIWFDGKSHNMTGGNFWNLKQ